MDHKSFNAASIRICSVSSTLSACITGKLCVFDIITTTENTHHCHTSAPIHTSRKHW